MMSARDAPYSRGFDLDADRHIDFGPDNAPIGIELLNVHLGISVIGLPESDDVAALPRKHDITILASTSIS
jgi:hypothetical protein